MYDRRQILKGMIAAPAALATTGMLTAPGIATAAGFEIIDPPQNTSTPDKVEVMEFFWFGCPHCYAFEPSIEAWRKSMPEHATFVREAPPLNPSWEVHSRAFYAAEAMKVTDKFVEPMFEEIHAKKKRMRKPKDIIALAGEIGLDEEKFEKMMSSFLVDTRMRRSVQLARSAAITGVPAIIVNGKYRISSSTAGSHDNMIAAINEAVEIERKAMNL